MKKTVFILLFPSSFLLSASCMAQDLKVLGATRQECSGRLSNEKINHHSVSYHFYLSPVNTDIVFDSLYLPYAAIKLDQTLSSRNPNSSLYVRINAVGDTYEIYVINPPLIKATPKGQDAGPARQFTGEGLIIYTCKGKAYTIPIVNMKQLHPEKIL